MTASVCTFIVHTAQSQRGYEQGRTAGVCNQGIVLDQGSLIFTNISMSLIYVIFYQKRGRYQQNNVNSSELGRIKESEPRVCHLLQGKSVSAGQLSWGRADLPNGASVLILTALHT